MTHKPSRKDQAVALKKYSASSLSDGVSIVVEGTYFEHLFLLNFGCNAIEAKLSRQEISDHLYDLESLASYMSIDPSHLSSQDTAKKIFKKVLPSVNVYGPSMVREFSELDILHIVNEVLPDLLISPVEGAPPVMLIEVGSKQYAQSIRKLYFNLYLQLITLRNTNPFMKKISGFTVPKKNITLGTVVATISWNPEQMKFEASLRRLSMSEFLAEVSRVYEVQRNLILSSVKHTHPVPITIEELERFLQITDIQGFFDSRFSIICYTESHVWKYPLVHHFLNDIMPPTVTSRQVLYRERRYKGFYVFKKLIDPLELEIIKRNCLRCFAISLFQAIVELHTHGYAHQDIRLPNICFDFDTEECYVILIDLDQANRVNFTPVFRGNSYMYIDTLNTSGEIDWRQYALLITTIHNGSSDNDYHTTQPDFDGLSFLESSFKNGDKPRIEQISQSLENFGLDLPLSCVVERQ